MQAGITAYRQLIRTAGITCCFFISACKNDVKQIDELTKKVIMKEEAYQVESYLSQSGNMKAKLTAPLMIRYLADTIYVEFTRSLHCDFYDSLGHKETWLDAKYGKYFESQNKVYLRDSVVVINTKGDTLKSQDLWWDQNLKLFYTDKPADYLAPDKKLYPKYGIEATQDFSRVTFREPTGIIKTKEDGSLQ